MKFKITREFTSIGGGSHEVEVGTIEEKSTEKVILKLSRKPYSLVSSDAIPVDVSGHYGRHDGEVYSIIGTRCAEWIRLELI